MSRGPGLAQRFGAGRLIELGKVYNIACAGESVGDDRLTLLAQFEGDDERWSAKLHAPQDYRDSAREAALNCRSRIQINASPNATYCDDLTSPRAHAPDVPCRPFRDMAEYGLWSFLIDLGHKGAG